MKILLYFPKLEPNKDFHYMPISALAVAANLLSKDHDVRIFDQRVDDPHRLPYLLWQADEFAITAYSGYQLNQAYEFAKRVKETCPNKKITWGGPHVTAFPAQALYSSYVDEIVCGDLESADVLSPYWLIDIHKYINPTTERFIYVSSYGCVGQCTFCQTKPRRKLRFLPFSKIESDIAYLMKYHPFKQAVFFDATLFTIPERALFISRLMRSYGLSWIADARADEICKMSKAQLDEIMSSGIVQLTAGMETGSERVARVMKKGRKHLQKFKQCAEIMNQYDVRLVSGCIFGTPGETPDDIRQTIDYIHEIRRIHPGFRLSTTFYMPLPATEMSEMAKQYGYTEPQTLEEWAARGAEGHYHYNEWQDVPWIIDVEEYKRIYEAFRLGNKDLFI